MAELSTFDTVTRSNEGVEMELKRLADGKPSGVFFMLLGKDGDEFRNISAERERFVSERIAGGGQLSAEEREELNLDMFARCTKGWRGLQDKSVPVPFSREKAKEVYSKYPGIREQANIFISERANFV